MSKEKHVDTSLNKDKKEDVDHLISDELSYKPYDEDNHWDPKGLISQLKPWDPKMINTEHGMMDSLLIHGKRKSGKSYGLRAILHELKDHFGAAKVWSKTEDCNGWYNSQCGIPKPFIRTYLDQDELQQVQESQKERMQNHGMPYPDGSPGKANGYLCCVFDDFAGDPAIRHTQQIDEFYLIGRHHHIMPIILTQHPAKINTDIRTNTDWALMYRTVSDRQKDHLWDAHGNVFHKKNSFKKMLDEVTNDYRALVYNGNENSLDPRDLFHIWKAPTVEPFLMGSEKYKDIRRKEMRDEEPGTRSLFGKIDIMPPDGSWKGAASPFIRSMYSKLVI